MLTRSRANADMNPSDESINHPSSGSNIVSFQSDATFAYQKASNLRLERYNIDDSIRIWLSRYEALCRAQGIPDFIRSQALVLYLPQSIVNWTYRLPETSTNDWSSFKKVLISRYGMDDDEEDRLGKAKLRSLRQLKNQSLREFAGEWEGLHSLLANSLSESQQVRMFAQSLFRESTRISLGANLPATFVSAVRLAIQAEEFASRTFVTNEERLVKQEVNSFNSSERYKTGRNSKSNSRMPKSSTSNSGFMSNHHSNGKSNNSPSTYFNGSCNYCKKKGHKKRGLLFTQTQAESASVNEVTKLSARIARLILLLESSGKYKRYSKFNLSRP